MRVNLRTNRPKKLNLCIFFTYHGALKTRFESNILPISYENINYIKRIIYLSTSNHTLALKVKIKKNKIESRRQLFNNILNLIKRIY